MNSTPIVLVPGFWLGAWAWDEVATILRRDGFEVTAVTLPGLESPESDRASVTLADHVDAIVSAVEAAGRPVVLATHSGAGAPGYAATDRVPGLIASSVYVDTGPATAALDPDFADAEKPLPSAEDLAENESLEGISEERLAEFRQRAVPQPGAALRDEPVLRNDARLDVPSVAVCTSFSAKDYQEAVEQGQTWLGGYAELRDVTWIDLPTSHWPMWSKPVELAAVLADAARSSSAG